MQKDQSFILRVRKYELRVAEPFILYRTLVPIMTAAYYVSSPSAHNGIIAILHNISFSDSYCAHLMKFVYVYVIILKDPIQSFTRHAPANTP